MYNRKRTDKKERQERLLKKCLDKPTTIVHLTTPRSHAKVAWKQTLPPCRTPTDLVPYLSVKPHVRLRAVNGEQFVLDKADLCRNLCDVIVLGTRPEQDLGLSEVFMREVKRLRLIGLLLKVGREACFRVV